MALRIVDHDVSDATIAVERGIVIVDLHEVQDKKKLFCLFLNAEPFVFIVKIPTDVAWLVTPSGTKIRRFANILFYGDSVHDIAMRDVFLAEVAPPSHHHEPHETWTLPPRVTERLLAMLDERSLLRLGATCRRMHVACTDAVVWMELFARRFGFLPPFAPVVKDGRRVSAHYWMSRFAHQWRECSVFGTLHLPKQYPPIPAARIARVVLIGPCNVGKSELVRSLRGDAPVLQYEPTSFVRTSQALGFVGGAKRLCGAKLWDIPGDPRNRSVSTVYCADTQCVLCVFDGSRRESFEALRNWVLEVRLHIHGTRRTRLLLIANKNDLGMDPGLLRDAILFARQEGLPLLRVSATAGAQEWRLQCWRVVADLLQVAFV